MNGGPGGLELEELEGVEGPGDGDREDANENEADDDENDTTSCREEDDGWRKERKTIFTAVLGAVHKICQPKMGWPRHLLSPLSAIVSIC